jgi:hypothetical protein
MSGGYRLSHSIKAKHAKGNAKQAQAYAVAERHQTESGWAMGLCSHERECVD